MAALVLRLPFRRVPTHDPGVLWIFLSLNLRMIMNPILIREDLRMVMKIHIKKCI